MAAKLNWHRYWTKLLTVTLCIHTASSHARVLSSTNSTLCHKEIRISLQTRDLPPELCPELWTWKISQRLVACVVNKTESTIELVIHTCDGRRAVAGQSMLPDCVTHHAHSLLQVCRPHFSNSATSTCCLFVVQVVPTVVLASLRQRCTNLSISNSPGLTSGTSFIGSIDSPLSSTATLSLFHSRLITFLFCKIFPP